MIRLYARVTKPLFLLLGLCLCLIDVPSAAAEGPISPHALEAFFDDVLARQMAEEHLVGATVAVVQDGALALAKGYGYADLDAGRPVEAGRTLFYIGSAGKLFTWTAVMQLVEQGKLDLHADVNAYLDFEVPAAFGQPITLHHLMTHTAGFEEELRAMLAADLAEVLPLREFLVRAMPQRIYPPGEVFAYSNYGTALAGYVVERVSGVSYERYVTERLLEPLGMAHSAALQPLPAALRADMSKGYHVRRNGRHDALDFEWAAAAPAAAIRGTATDLAQFMIAHLNDGCVEGGCILRPETVADMHRQQFTHHPALTGMAYGFVESQMNGQRILWHMGESARFVTVLALLPQEGVGLLVSYNTPPVDGRTILFRFLDEFYPVDRPTRAASALPGWNERAGTIGGSYVSSRVALHSPQKVIGWLDTLSVRAAADGTLALGPQRYVETGPWLFHQQAGDRGLAHQERNGQPWLFWGPFAYRKVPWYQTLTFHGALVVMCALIFVSGWLAWPLAAWRDARRGHTPSAGVRRARWLAVALGLLDLVLLAWFLSLMVAYGQTYAYPARAVDLVVRLNWLAAPLALAVLVVAVRSWVLRTMHWAWRVHYTLIAIAGIAFLWFLGFWNLLAGLPL